MRKMHTFFTGKWKNQKSSEADSTFNHLFISTFIRIHPFIHLDIHSDSSIHSAQHPVIQHSSNSTYIRYFIIHPLIESKRSLIHTTWWFFLSSAEVSVRNRNWLVFWLFFKHAYHFFIFYTQFIYSFFPNLLEFFFIFFL